MVNLRVKIFVAFFSLIIIPLFLLGVTAFFVVSDMIEKKYSEQTEFTLNALKQSVNFLFREMDQVTDSTIASRALQEVLDKSSYEQKEYMKIDYLEMNEIQRSFKEMLVFHPSVSYAFMYVLNNSSMIWIYSKEDVRSLSFERFKEHQVYRETLERKGLPKWVGPFEYPEVTGSGPVFTQIRVVKDLNSLQDQAIMFVQIKGSGMEAIFREFSTTQQDHQTRFFIVNDKGTIFFDSSHDAAGQNVNEYTSGGLKFAKGYQSTRLNFADQESIVSSIGLGREHWQLVSVTSWSSLTSEVYVYVKGLATFTILMLLLAFMYNMFFVNRIAKSITRIVRFMRRMENGELQVRVEEKGNDEIFLLSRGFNSLIGKVNELLDQVKREQSHKNKAEMRVLQAQIKPHFLFNTLESINALAVQNKGKQVSQMVQRLGRILRISIQDKEEISIRQEIEHLRSYLEIQKFRFEELFEFEIDIPEDVMNCSILKLTLQPLVENSIQHGFEGIDYIGRIRIAAEVVREQIVFTIEDNGIGIPASVLAKFQYQADEGYLALQEKHAHGERRGLGVHSVADRIRIQYGSDYGLYVCSLEQNGTIIRCAIPKYIAG